MIDPNPAHKDPDTDATTSNNTYTEEIFSLAVIAIFLEQFFLIAYLLVRPYIQKYLLKFQLCACFKNTEQYYHSGLLTVGCLPLQSTDYEH